MMNVYVVIIPVVILILLILLLGTALGLATFIMTGKRQSLEEAFAWQTAHYDTSFYETIEKEEYIVQSTDGYELHVQLLKNPVPTTRYMLISHGYTDNRMGALKYVPLYLALGFHCIIYDLRGHGLNQLTYTTYGIREGRDIAALVQDIRQRYPDLSVLGLHGESLGAASTITALKYRPAADFVVADCGFMDIENVLRGGFRMMHVPQWLYPVADFGAKLRYHHSFREMQPIMALSENEIPILFLHGSKDTLIPPRNSEEMCKRTKGYGEVHLIEGAAHAEAVIVDPVSYRAYTEAFLKQLGILAQ
ncbi:MAG: alpha/beta fold hydrolase [Lachnospiraceae bacterium]|nr:alpha/beta fold hydrolase [Lachnospiraceae bacterium]